MLSDFLSFCGFATDKAKADNHEQSDNGENSKEDVQDNAANLALGLGSTDHVDRALVGALVGRDHCIRTSCVDTPGATCVCESTT